MNTEKCPINVEDKFSALASAHRPQKKCGKDAVTISELPIRENGMQRLEYFKLCPLHAVETAVGKMRHPARKWTTPELLYLFEAGCLVSDLIGDSSFPATLSLHEKEKPLKTEIVKLRIKVQCENLRQHPDLRKFPPFILDRLELLEMFVS